jgi:hypothetical protein
MTTNISPTKSGFKSGQGRVLPDEKFWQRYSSYQEAPLSVVTSLAVHVLVIGGLVLLAYLGWLGFNTPSKSIPIDLIHVERGSSTIGKDNSPGSNNQGPQTVEPTTANQGDPAFPPMENRPQLHPSDLITPSPTAKAIKFSPRGHSNIFAQIQEEAKNKKRPDTSSPGRSGPGSKDGKGTGEGLSEGKATGSGKEGKLTPREQRMLRWTMQFNTRTPEDYLAQLRSLGAILAIPTDPENKSYKVIRDLSGRYGEGGAKLLDEDITKIPCIFWVDDRPQSVEALSKALKLKAVPKHIVAFMPAELEKKLFDLESKAAKCPEDEIFETRFEVVPAGRSGFQPRVVSVTRR